MAKKKKTNAKKPPYRWHLWVFWVLFWGGILGVTAIFSAAALGYLGPMPDLQQLENPKTNLEPLH